MPKKCTYTTHNIICDTPGVYYTRGAETISRVVDGETTKKVTGFDDVDMAYRALDQWRGLGFRGGPGSPASFFRAMLARMHAAGQIRYRCNATVNALLSSSMRGPWIESFFRGTELRPCRLYDLNAAYYSACLPGLPVWLYPRTRKDDRFIAVMTDVRRKGGGLIPSCARSGSPSQPRTVVVTSEMIDTLGLDGTIIHALAYDDCSVALGDVFYELVGHVDRDIFKRIAQTYWGTFCGSHQVEAYSVSHFDDKGNPVIKKSWVLRNHMQNFAWASLITQRVAMTLLDAVERYDGISVYVDSVLCTREMPTGEMWGEWKLERAFPTGVEIRGPGTYDAYPAAADVGMWYRHAGVRPQNHVAGASWL